VKLEIYRSLIRNPKPAQDLEVEMLALRRTLHTPLAPGGSSK
jgi:hypothetical protein